MTTDEYPLSRSCSIPADCFNLVRLAHRKTTPFFFLPGHTDNLIYIGENNWRLWNRRLNSQLMSWSDFRNGERSALSDPVQCTLTLHHSYSRTLIYHIYDCLKTRMSRELEKPDGSSISAIIDWPGRRAS